MTTTIARTTEEDMSKELKTAASQTALVAVLERAGWSIDFIDLDLTGPSAVASIRIRRHDGLQVDARVDHVGRATMERSRREVVARAIGGSDVIGISFIGRTRYEGPRQMLRYLCAYITDNALRHACLSDVRSAWAAVMSAPTSIGFKEAA